MIHRRNTLSRENCDQASTGVDILSHHCMSLQRRCHRRQTPFPHNDRLQSGGQASAVAEWCLIVLNQQQKKAAASRFGLTELQMVRDTIHAMSLAWYGALFRAASFSMDVEQIVP